MSIDSEVLSGIRYISSDRVHGATFVAAEAARILQLAAETSRASDPAELVSELRWVAGALIQARPSMAPVGNVVARLLYTASVHARRAKDAASLRASVRRAVQELLDEQRGLPSRIAANAAPLFSEGDTVMTHSYSSTVKEALTANRAKGLRVIVTEARPLYEGRGLAKELSAIGMKVTLILDAAAAHHMKEANKALVGADAVLIDGSVVNKIGTLPLALAAYSAQVPFYVACDTWKFSAQTVRTALARLEEREGYEVANPKELPGVKLRNVYFDITPPSYIRGIICEKGVVQPQHVARYVERFAKYFRALRA